MVFLCGLVDGKVQHRLTPGSVGHLIQSHVASDVKTPRILETPCTRQPWRDLSSLRMIVKLSMPLYQSMSKELGVFQFTYFLIGQCKIDGCIQVTQLVCLTEELNRLFGIVGFDHESKTVQRSRTIHFCGLLIASHGFLPIRDAARHFSTVQEIATFRDGLCMIQSCRFLVILVRTFHVSFTAEAMLMYLAQVKVGLRQRGVFHRQLAEPVCGLLILL